MPPTIDLNIAIDLNRSPVSSSPPVPSGPSPRSIMGANCLASWEPDTGITIGGVLLAGGTTPPQVTISGTLSTVGAVPFVQIDGAGALGAATFKWGLQGPSGAMVATGVLTGASVALGTSGLTASFSAGTYATDNTYKATCAGWADQTSNQFDLVQITSGLQHLLVYNALNGHIGLQSDGVDDSLISALSFPAVSISAPMCHWLLLRQDAWTINTFIIGGTNARGRLTANPTTPNLVIQNQFTSAAASLAIGSFKRVQGFWANTTTDDHIVAGANVGAVGTALGAQTVTNYGLGPTAGKIPAYTVVAWAAFNAFPTPAQQTSLDQLAVTYGGASMIT